MDWPIERKVQWGLAIAVAVLCCLGLVAYAVVVSFVNASHGVIHSHLVIEAIQGARTGLDDAESSVRGYLLTHDPSYLGPYNLIRGRIPGAIDRVRLLTSDNPAQHQRVARVKSQAGREMMLMQQAVDMEAAHSISPEAQRQLLDEDQQVMSAIRNTFREVRLEEDQLQSLRDAAWRQNFTEAIIAAAALGLLNFVLLGSTYYVFSRDITRRRSAEKALQASEERLRLLFASVKDYAFFMLDPQGRVTTWNQGAAILKGYEASEIIGRPFGTFFTEEDAKAGKPRVALETAAKLGRVEFEGWRVRKGGARFWADAITSAIRDEQGNLIGFSEVTRDQTEKRAAEEKARESQARLAGILEGSPSVIFVKDPEGRYTLVNRRFEDSFHMTRDQVLGRTDMDLFPREAAQILHDHDVKTLETGTAMEFEEVIPQKDGPHTFLAARVPLLGKDQKPYALCGVATDITERKESEQEIRSLNRALQDRIVDRSVELMHAGEELKMEKAERQAAEEREQQIRHRLREVIHESAVPMWTYDVESLAFLEVNEAAVGLHSLPREQLRQMRMSDLYPGEDLNRAGEEAEKAGGADKSLKIWRYRAPDGRALPLGILVRRVEWEGRNAALVIVVSRSEAKHLREISKALEAAG